MNYNSEINADINNWVQKGCIFIWSYKGNPKNYQGFHLSSDFVGCNSLIKLLGLFSKSDQSAKRTLKLSKPDNKVYSIPNCNSKPIAYQKCLIQFEARSKSMAIKTDKEKIIITIGKDYISKIINGLTDIKKGSGDYQIGDSISQLWFWWY